MTLLGTTLSAMITNGYRILTANNLTEYGNGAGNGSVLGDVGQPIATALSALH